ncbi:MAG TPA: AAA family ATPase [Alphaproteobacteria bacterium]|nr:AAA family ATPase [Alphaproteobacteria bacterium]
MPQPERHGLAWSAEEEKQLYDAFAAGAPYEKCAAAHQRTAGGIVSCLKKLGVLDEDGNIITPRPPFAPSGAAQKRALRKEQKEAVRKKWAASALTPENPAPELNDKFREALRLMEDTDKNIFITGKAGTGKSTLLSWFCRVSRKAPVILAPTGVAALNVKGQTIHNFFNFYVDVTPEKIRRKKNKPRNAKLYQKLRCLVIDEISMVRADLMDCIDAFLRRYGPDPAREFGGVQMILIGDLYQLPPVVTSAERELFSSHYDSPYFFSAHALKNHALAQIELEKIYRQKDREFVALLNKIRNNSADENDLAHLNSRLGTSPLPAPAAQKGFSITLTTTNALADQVNETHLAALKGEMHVSEAGIEGDFGREYYPTAVELRYKAGAQIMMLNNDSEKRWVNGSLGAIESIEEDEDGKHYLAVRLEGRTGTVEVYRHDWEVYRFGVEGNEIVSEPVGRFTQYPFRLAWAVTIHKSQGKTFPRVTIDVGRGAFAAGQMYVALSRCISFEGVTLKTPIRARDIQTDPRIFEFLGAATDRITVASNDEAGIETGIETGMPLGEKIALIRRAIAENFALDIEYLKADDTRTQRKVTPLSVGRATYQGKHYDGMKAHCALRDETRMFRVERILRMGRAQ